MKTFKQHIISEEGEGIGTHDQNSVEDGSMGVHNVHDPDVLKRVNAFVGSIAMKEYLILSSINLMNINKSLNVSE